MARQAIDFLVHTSGLLYTMEEPGLGASPRRGADLARVGIVEGGAVAALEGVIVAVGPLDEVRDRIEFTDGTTVLDAGRRAIVPGFVDPHTHAVFGWPRSDEFGRRLTGESYQSIAASGGGIRASTREFRKIGKDQLLELTRARLRAALCYGTTTMEIKSGYGLDFDSEIKALEVVAELAGEEGLPRTVATCLAAHEIPDEYRDDREAYLRIVCDEVLPAVAERGLAERVDVFCEPGVYTPEETERVLARGRELGLRSTVHADELDGSGGAEVAVRMGSDSADHLGAISEGGIAALADSETVGVLLPGTIFSLGLDNQAPARSMIDRGVALALATDFNPGSNWCESVPLTMAIACTRLKLHPHEALAMATLNAAHALGRGAEAGSLAVGKRCDCNVLREQSVDSLCHHLGLDPVDSVIVDGRVRARIPAAGAESAPIR
jgi:imidazolonepropionase